MNPQSGTDNGDGAAGEPRGAGGPRTKVPWWLVLGMTVLLPPLGLLMCDVLVGTELWGEKKIRCNGFAIFVNASGLLIYCGLRALVTSWHKPQPAAQTFAQSLPRYLKIVAWYGLSILGLGLYLILILILAAFVMSGRV